MTMNLPKLMLRTSFGVCFAILSIAAASAAAEQSESVMVNADNFVRAETAAQFDTSLKQTKGAVNEWLHFRTPAPIDQQTVIRMNRDTPTVGRLSTSARAQN
jgi:hypothetical protein